MRKKNIVTLLGRKIGLAKNIGNLRTQTSAQQNWLFITTWNQLSERCMLDRAWRVIPKRFRDQQPCVRCLLYSSADSILHGNSCQVCNNSPMSCLNPRLDLFPCRSHIRFLFYLFSRMNDPKPFLKSLQIIMYTVASTSQRGTL